MNQTDYADYKAIKTKSINMQLSKTDIGFDKDDELTIVHFENPEDLKTAENYLDGRSILNHYWDVKGTTPNNERALLMRTKDAARLHPDFDAISGIKTNLLT